MELIKIDGSYMSIDEYVTQQTDAISEYYADAIDDDLFWPFDD